MSRFSRSVVLILLGTGSMFLVSACRHAGVTSRSPSASSISLLDQKLLDVIDQEEQLNKAAADPQANSQDIQRMFHDVAREYEGVLARNPRHLESRLLYGKLLARYGDREGARRQFLEAAQIDPDIAVIHQQLSKYYAEDGDHTRALAYALNAVRIEPRTAAYHFGLGQLLAAFRDKFLEEEVFTTSQLDEEMLRAFSTARDLEPDSLALQFRYGEAFYDVSNPDWQLALDHWISLASRPDLSPLQLDAVLVHQARCLSELDRPAEASSVLENVQSQSLKNASLPSSGS